MVSHASNFKPRPKPIQTTSQRLSESPLGLGNLEENAPSSSPQTSPATFFDSGASAAVALGG